MVSPAASAGRLGSALPFLLVLLDLQYQGEPGRGPVGVPCEGRCAAARRCWAIGRGGWWPVALPPSLLSGLRRVRHGGGARTPHPPPSPAPAVFRRKYFGKGCEEGGTALPPHRSGPWRRARTEGTAAAGGCWG